MVLPRVKAVVRVRESVPLQEALAVRANNHPKNLNINPVDMYVVVDLLEGKINAPA
jgi:hypothetical protein